MSTFLPILRLSYIFLVANPLEGRTYATSFSHECLEAIRSFAGGPGCSVSDHHSFPAGASVRQFRGHIGQSGGQRHQYGNRAIKGDEERRERRIYNRRAAGGQLQGVGEGGCLSDA